MHPDRTGRYILLGLVGFFLAFSLTVDYRRAVGYFFGDEAVYYMMAQSIAFDADLKYTARDLQRAYADGWHAGPLGIFLSKLENGKIIYAKYPVYALFVAPFLRIFGFNGFLILNVLMWGLMIWMGWAYLRQFNVSGWALFVAITFFTLSASFIYTFWVTPETFNMFCITSGLFLWMYRRDTDFPVPKVSGWSLNSRLRWLFGTPQGRLYLAPIPIAIAAASKAPNILFLAPMLADVLLIERLDRAGAPTKPGWHLLSLRLTRADLLTRVRKLALIGLVTLLVIGSLYGFQYLMTGQTNAYAGDRKTFYGPFPFGSPGDVWERGIRLSNDDYSFFFHPKTILYDLYYYVFGRFTGLFPYFFGTFIAGYYALQRLFRPKTDSRNRLINWRRGFLGLTIVGSILGYILIAPTNYQGGGGAFGNRFFLNIYPAFLFLITTMRSLRPLAVNWMIGSLFLAQPLLTPFKTSFAPATHAFRFPYRFLPAERTLVDTLPTNVNSHLMQTALSAGQPSYRLYFCDENISDFTAQEFWVHGQKDTELLLRTFQGQRHLQVTIVNGPIPNRVTVWAAGQKHSVVLTIPGEVRHLVLPLRDPMPFFADQIYGLKVRSETGFVSTFTPGTDLNDLRYLGTWVSLSLDDADVGRRYAEQGQAQTAIEILQPLADRQPDDAMLHYALGTAYAQSGNSQAALRELQGSLALLPEFQETFIKAYNAQNPEHPLPNISNAAEIDSLQTALTPLTLSYEAETLLRGTGGVAHDPEASQAEAASFDADADAPGFLAYGQYVTLPTGRYQVRLRFKTLTAASSAPESGAPQSGLSALSCDVYSQQYGILAQQKILPEPRADYQTVAFNVELAHNTPLEFRVKTTGSADVLLDTIVVYPLFPAQLYHQLAVTTYAENDWNGARRLLQQVIAFDGGTPEFQRDYVRLLREQQPQEVAGFIAEPACRSAWQTGCAAYLVESDPALQALVNATFTPEISDAHTFGDAVQLIGYDAFPPTVSPGATVPFQLYWKALRKIDENLKFTIHLVKQSVWPDIEMIELVQKKLGTPRITRRTFEYVPVDGAYPTQDWLAGEYIRDVYNAQIPSNLMPGRYTVLIKILHPLDRQPLRSGQAQSVKLGELSIEE